MENLQDCEKYSSCSAVPSTLSGEYWDMSQTRLDHIKPHTFHIVSPWSPDSLIQGLRDCFANYQAFIDHERELLRKIRGALVYFSGSLDELKHLHPMYILYIVGLIQRLKAAGVLTETLALQTAHSIILKLKVNVFSKGQEIKENKKEMDEIIELSTEPKTILGSTHFLILPEQNDMSDKGSVKKTKIVVGVKNPDNFRRVVGNQPQDQTLLELAALSQMRAQDDDFLVGILTDFFYIQIFTLDKTSKEETYYCARGQIDEEDWILYQILGLWITADKFRLSRDPNYIPPLLDCAESKGDPEAHEEEDDDEESFGNVSDCDIEDEIEYVQAIFDDSYSKALEKETIYRRLRDQAAAVQGKCILSEGNLKKLEKQIPL